MKIDSLIELIKKEMKGKDSWLRNFSTSTSKDPIIYVNDDKFKILPEYQFLHELARNSIIDQEPKGGLIEFTANANTLDALNNPSAFFYKIKV